MPTKAIAAISSVVAIGRRMNGSDRFMIRRRPSLAERWKR
jgi:hypothetical protein